jgi:8-oxo-dGTP pyrophosphatase MutT (NUDIX family)
MRSFALAMRQTWEEIGIDLAENAFTLVGQLDDREITTSLGKRLLMILSPFGTHDCRD